MGESWRISIGSMLPPRRSTESTGAALEADDFHDVFGGPPRTVLLRRFSGEIGSGAAASLYDEIFRPGEYGIRLPRAPWIGVPAARALRTEEGFYDDIFGSEGGDPRLRSRSKSMSRSGSLSSVMSSEDLSPPLRRRPICEDSMLSSFASRLRPITIPSRQHLYSSPPSTLSTGDQNSLRTPTIPRSSLPCFVDPHAASSAFLLRQKAHPHIGFSCCFSSLATTSLEPVFRQDSDEEVDYSDVGSPSSAISSAFPDKGIVGAGNVGSSSSFFIEIDNRGVGDATAVDEAIAWAKETQRSRACKGVGGEEQNELKEIQEVAGESLFAQGSRGSSMVLVKF